MELLRYHRTLLIWNDPSLTEKDFMEIHSPTHVNFLFIDFIIKGNIDDEEFLTTKRLERDRKFKNIK